MIDFEQELGRYNMLEMDKELSDMKHESSICIQSFNAMIKKLRKEQNEVNYQVEEVLTVLDELKNKDQALTELKESQKSTEEEKLNLVKSFISVLDLFEEYYKYIQKHAGQEWIEQFSSLWDKASNILLTQGIYRIEGENTPFDPRLNVAKMLSNHDSLPEGTITEVIRCGYIYNSHVLRKAEVVVNKKGGEAIE